MRSTIIEIVETIVKLIMSRVPAHGLDHVMRVRKLALLIARDLISKGIAVDLEVLELASLLHDIGRVVSEENHAIVSAKIAKKILKCLGYPEDKIESVVHAIEAHSYSSNIKPRTIEAMILSDADKIDALGAIGIARVISYGAIKGRSLSDSLKHFIEKILRLKDMMYTELGKKLARERSKIVELYVETLRRELSEYEEILENKF